MAELKTKQTEESVADFINKLEDEQKRKDSFTIIEMMKQATGLPAKMWGTGIVGFGNYHYKYESGHEGDMCITGFSPRKQNFALYVGAGTGKIPELLKTLGKHKTGKSCLYINKLSDVDIKVLQKIINTSFRQANKG